MPQPDARLHVDQIRQEKIEKDSPDLRGALRLLAEELNTKDTHFILELLQNAEDNDYAGNRPELKLWLEDCDPTGTPSADGCLVVLNNEAGFRPEDVRSLSSVGQSTKKDRNRGYIGEKGIGFKSVFRITDRPHVFSNGYQFRFESPRSSDELGYILPHWVEDLPPFVKAGYTAILLPLLPGKKGLISRQLDRIAPETVLFLKKLKELRLGANSVLSAEGAPPLVTLQSDDVASPYFVCSRECEKPPGITEEKRIGIIRREITIALPFRSDRACKGRIFAFLPTEFDSGLPFLVNADFVLNSNRERVLEDRPWNRWLRDEIAATFTKALLSVLENHEWRVGALRFVPTPSDLASGADFFSPVVSAIQAQVRDQRCVLTSSGELALPSQARTAGGTARRLLRDLPPGRLSVALVHPELEHHREKLQWLGVQPLTTTQLIDSCRDVAWLRGRDAEWWDVFLELLSQREITAEALAGFPILRCCDAELRSAGGGVFFQAEGQQAPTSIPRDWPAAHLLDPEIRTRIQGKASVWAWLLRISGLRPFSVQSYVTTLLLRWMRTQGAAQLVAATKFIALNLRDLDEAAKGTLRGSMPWLLSDGSVLLPEQRGGKELVTPEAGEGEAGWNWVFISDQDREHFRVLSDDYMTADAGTTNPSMRALMAVCAVTDFPDPARVRRPGGYLDWCCPRWLRDLSLDSPPQNLERKVTALQRWVARFGPDRFAAFLHIAADDPTPGGPLLSGYSELGLALRIKPWLQSAKGLVAPVAGLVDAPDIREFLGGSVAYISSSLPLALLEKLGVGVRLTAALLLTQLRQMRDRANVDEALVVKIYRRLHTTPISRDVFRTEPLVYLAVPVARWMTTDKLFWSDAGDVFDDEFGYAELTYKNEELHGFFADTLAIADTPGGAQLAMVWAQMAENPHIEAETVEKRLAHILPSLAETLEPENPPPWWIDVRPRLRVWTTTRRFCDPHSVFTPDDSFSESLFTGSARIAWVPRSHLTARLNRLLRTLGCSSLIQGIESKAVGAEGVSSSASLRFLTPASKELVVSWACANGHWMRAKSVLESLLMTEEAEIADLAGEYWLAGTGLRESRPVDAFWESESRILLLRVGATEEARRSAVASSIALRLDRQKPESADQVYRLLCFDPNDAKSVLAAKKWVLSPEQQKWLSGLGVPLCALEIGLSPAGHAPRRARDPIAATTSTATPQPPAATPAGPLALTTIADAQDTPRIAFAPAGLATRGASGTEPSHAGGVSSPAPAVSPSRIPRQIGVELDGARQPSTDAERQRPTPALKREDSKAEFVTVAAHTRSAPQRQPRKERESNRLRAGEHPMGAMPHATKAQIEDLSVKVVMSLMKDRPEWTGFLIEDLRHRNLGFDILAIKKGVQLRIEVKAHLRQASSVFVTAREWQESRRSCVNPVEDRWELWNVENLGAEAGNIRVTRYPHIPNEARSRESGFWVDLGRCGSAPTG